MKKFFFFSFLALCGYNDLLAQNQATIDSLLKITKSQVNDSNKINTYLKIVRQYENTDSVNTAKYANKAIELAQAIGYQKGEVDALESIAWVTMRKGHYKAAKKLCRKVVKLANLANYLKGKGKGFNNLAAIFYYEDNYPEALEYNHKALAVYTKLKYTMGMASCYNALGLILKEQGDYGRALEYNFEALKLLEKLNQKHRMGYVYNNIGIIFRAQDEPEKAIEYYKKSLKIEKELGDKRGMSSSFNNIGNVLEKQKKYPEALECFLKSLKIKEELGNKLGMAFTYNNIGILYKNQGKYDEALKYCNKSWDISQEINSKTNMMHTANTLGQIYYHKKQLKLAREKLKEGIQLGLEIGSPVNVKFGAENLAKVEATMGNYKVAYKYHQLFKKMEDSLKNSEQTKKLTRLEMSYRFQKEKDVNKAKRIALEKEIENERLTQQATFIVIGLLIFLVLTLFLFFQSKRRSNKLLVDKSQELEVANEEVKISNEELKITLETIELQRDKILDSIQYAQNIQTSILPRIEYIKQLFPEFFVLYQPRDIVSGDFYWVADTGNKIILAAVDCTGHGVPGAFMSMIGNDALNNIVKERRIYQADEILFHMHRYVYGALQQKETQNEDGMDMALVVIDQANKTLEFAGAKNPLIYVQNGKLHRLKGAKRGIGGEPMNKETVYHMHTLDISEPTTFYLFSDGYQDQFGGPHNRKFMSKQFYDVLFDSHTKPMTVQKNILEDTLNNWMQQYKTKADQIDDILVIGVKV